MREQTFKRLAAIAGLLWLPLIAAAESAPSAAVAAPSTAAAAPPALAEQARLYDIADGYVVGEQGIMLKAVGTSWQLQPLPLRISLLRLAPGAGTLWALGHEASLLRLDGQQWRLQQQQPGSDRPLFDLLFVDGRRGWAVGAYGLLLQSEDGGHSWQPRLLTELLAAEDRDYLAELQTTDDEAYAAELQTILPHFNAIAASPGGALAIAGEAGLVALSADGGQHWQALTTPYQGSFFTALWVDADHLLVAGLRGHLYRYQRSSGQWQRLPLPGERHINRLQRLDDAHVLALGNSGQLNIIHWASGTVHSEQVAEGPDLFAAEVRGQQALLATSKGLVRWPLVLAGAAVGD